MTSSYILLSWLLNTNDLLTAPALRWPPAGASQRPQRFAIPGWPPTGTVEEIPGDRDLMMLGPYVYIYIYVIICVCIYIYVYIIQLYIYVYMGYMRVGFKPCGEH